MERMTAEDIQEALASRDFERGRRYHRQGRARVVSISPDGSAIEGDVRGSRPRPYDVRVRLQTNGRGLVVEGWCRCPVGYNCKHVAALLLEASERPIAAPDTAPLSPHWQTWLANLDRAAETQTNDYPEYIRHRLIYVLSLTPNPFGSSVLAVATLSVRLLKDGHFSEHFGHYDPSNAFGPQPAKFLRPVDHAILRDLAHSASSGYGSTRGHVIRAETGAKALARILETGRGRWGSIEGPILARGNPRAAEGGWTVRPDGSQRFSFSPTPGLAVLPLAPPWYVDPADGECGPLETGLPATIAAMLAEAPAVAPREAAALAEELARRIPGQPALAPRVLERAPDIKAKPTPCLRLARRAATLNWQYGTYGRQPHEATIAVARLSFDYGGQRVDATEESHRPTAVVDGRLTTVIRDLATERRAHARLAGLGLVPYTERYIHRYDEPAEARDDLVLPEESSEAWLRFLRRNAPALEAEGWRIEPGDALALEVVEADGEWAAEIETTGIDWFELHLGVMIDGGRVDILPAVLHLIRGERFAGAEEDGEEIFIPLGDGRVVALPVSRLRPIVSALHDLLDIGFGDDAGIGFTRGRAGDLAAFQEAVGAESLTWRGGEDLLELGRRLRGFRRIEPVEPPTGFKGNLRPYQREGLDWLQFLRAYEVGGVLADDMGLGKTVQALAHLVIEKESGRMDRPSLIVAPTSLMANWRFEANRFAPSLRVLTLHGRDRHDRLSDVGAHDVVLTTYALLARDRDALMGQSWHFVILDEAQTIKNPRTAAAQVACAFDARHRLCLTGTPMENHLGELWSLFRFLIPGLLGNSKTFRSSFRTPIEKHGDEHRREALNRRVRPFLLRRTKDQVAADLPPKTDILDRIEMSGPQRDLYESIRLAMHEKVRRAIEDKGLARSHIIFLDALLKLRQACCDPRLVRLAGSAGRRAGSAKLERLMEMVPELLSEGGRILLFSQFTSMLSLIADELAKAKIGFETLIGSTQDRAGAVRRFQEGEVPLFLVSLKAGGTGLNLTAADTVIHYDPWWNPAVENQATDRAHRIGQDKAVFVHKLIALSSIEEKMLDLQARKHALVEGLFAGSLGSTAAISEEDVSFLLAPA